MLIDRWNCGSNSNCATLSVTQDNACGTGGSGGSGPVNDDCSNATMIACGESIDGSTTNATTDVVSDCGTSITSKGVWYEFEGTGQWTTFSVCNDADYDTKINVYNGSCGSLSCSGGNDDGSGCSGYSSELSLYCHASVTYFILVQGYGGETGDFTLTCTCTTASADPQDCTGGITICTDDTFGGNAGNYGSYQELNSTNNDCLSVEHQSSWFFFSPLTTGTIEFTLTPTNGIDYDFAIWGPYEDLQCPPFEDPLRCTYSDDYAPTGLLIGAGDTSEPPSGDAWVEAITVSTEDLNMYYVMLIDNWTADNTSYNFDWNLTGVTLDCSIQLPVEMLYITAEVLDERNVVRWGTASEVNNDFFEVQRSTDIINWDIINIIEGHGTTQDESHYLVNDTSRPIGNTYYRLRQVDYNGDFSYSDIVHVNNHAVVDLLSLYPNPTRSEIHVTLQAVESMTLNIAVTDLSGRKVMHKLVQVDPGINIFSYDLSSLTHGLYTLQIADEGALNLITEKLFKK